ncbi:MAG: hypothetical protein D3916_15720 [Candidatus Electrothrix sp. MAN1_4]|nr:hypothetical protein [Candidatus Electrothrix sp. MAN1_4]
MKNLLKNITRRLPVMPDAVGANPCVRPNLSGRHRGLPLQRIPLPLIFFLVTLAYSPIHAETAQEKMAVLVSNAGTDSVIAGKEGWLFLKEELEQLSSPILSGQGIEPFSKATKKNMLIRSQQLLISITNWQSVGSTFFLSSYLPRH